MAFGRLHSRCSRLELAHRVALEGEPVAVVDEAIEDRVGDGGIFEVGMPLLDRELARCEFCSFMTPFSLMLVPARCLEKPRILGSRCLRAGANVKRRHVDKSGHF